MGKGIFLYIIKIVKGRWDCCDYDYCVVKREKKNYLMLV